VLLKKLLVDLIVNRFVEMDSRSAADSGNPQGDFLKVGLIGCGRIAEHHLRFISRTAGARVVALSDPILTNAQRLAEQYAVKKIHRSYVEMLDATALDVIHILTPPELHYQQAMDVIDRGVHVLLEKPCTIYPQELEELYRRAEAKGVLLCPDFIHLFNPIFLEAAALVDGGKLGRPIHIESHLSVDLNTPELQESIGLPWRFKLPGGILHDNITHLLYMTLRWLGEPVRVSVCGRSNGTLSQGLTDQLAVMLEGEQCTANLFMSAVVKPEPYYLHIFCEHGHVRVDFDTSTALVTRTSSLPRFLRRATANFIESYKLFSQGLRNSVRFARGRLVPYQGLENLIPWFYESIRNKREVPVSKGLAIAVGRTEAHIFAQPGHWHPETRNRPSRQKSIAHGEKILITGATGYLGSAIARQLVKNGYYVRALVRLLSHTEHLEALGAELVYGDIRDHDQVLKAMDGMDVVVHAAAALRGSSDFMLDCAIKGTRNIADAAKIHNLKRVIYISSMSVYDSLKLCDGEIISEGSPLEEFPQLRGSYSLAKRRAEDQALGHLRDVRPQWTILRPSVIVGERYDLFSPVGKKTGKLLFCAGSKRRILNLVHVQDVASAILNLIRNDAAAGRIFNISADAVKQEAYIDQFIRQAGYHHLKVIYIPYWIARAAAGILTAASPLSRRIPIITRRRLASLYRSTFTNTKAIRTQIGWEPRPNLLGALLVEAQGLNVPAANGRISASIHLDARLGNSRTAL